MSIFNKSSNIDVLNTKFQYYENLSKEMLEKLENAVEKISESNSNIAAILVKHDERITVAMERDKVFSLELEKFKIKYEKDREVDKKNLKEVLNDINKRVDSNTNFRWKAIGMGTILGLLIGILGTPMVSYLTKPPEPPRMQRLP